MQQRGEGETRARKEGEKNKGGGWQKGRRGCSRRLITVCANDNPAWRWQRAGHMAHESSISSLTSIWHCLAHLALNDRGGDRWAAGVVGGEEKK